VDLSSYVIFFKFFYSSKIAASCTHLQIQLDFETFSKTSKIPQENQSQKNKKNAVKIAKWTVMIQWFWPNHLGKYRSYNMINGMTDLILVFFLANKSWFNAPSGLQEGLSLWYLSRIMCKYTSKICTYKQKQVGKQL